MDDVLGFSLTSVTTSDMSVDVDVARRLVGLREIEAVVLCAEKDAYQDDDSAEEKHEEVREIKLNDGFVLDDSHHRRLGCYRDVWRF
jgi:hypothetical protein